METKEFLIEDVDFEHTNEITFYTKYGKEVTFVKRKQCKGCIHLPKRYKFLCTSCARNTLLLDRWEGKADE